MNKTYTEEYLLKTLAILSDDLIDLATWSIYNNDEELAAIQLLKLDFDDIKDRLETLVVKRSGRNLV